MLSYLFRIVSVCFADEVQADRGQDLALVPLLAQPHVLVILFLRYRWHMNSPQEESSIQLCFSVCVLKSSRKRLYMKRF